MKVAERYQHEVQAAKCVATPAKFAWCDDRPPRHSWANTVIYETHVSGCAALMGKIPYLKELGVTAVELPPVEELKEMVRELHGADIEVILDAVPGHAAESGRQEPTLCWHGADSPGLTLLRHWVADMHVDGLRLDLSTVLGRDCVGRVLNNLPLLERISADPILRDVKLIAEGWAAAGAYEVETFSDCRWGEWNHRYRDDVRRFWRGDEGMVGAFASRICGSEDLYGKSGKGPECGINLMDLAAEGICTRQMKNLLLTLFVSRGVPMLRGSDELPPDVHAFAVRMARLRKDFPVLSRERFYTSHALSWFSAKGGAPEWNDPRGKSVGCHIHDSHDALYLMFNAEDKPSPFTIPAAPEGRRWRLAADTHTDIPGAIIDHDRQYLLGPRSGAVLVAAGVTTGGSHPEIDCCADAMEGGDPDVAYAAAMLWYQGYPESFGYYGY